MDEGRQSMASLPIAWIGRLFERMSLIYGTDKVQGMWRGQSIEDVQGFWSEELAGYSAEELRRGVQAMRNNPTWPPTLYEFMDLCRPPQGQMSPEAAFYEAVRATEQRKRGEMGAWSKPAHYWAMMDVSAFDVLNSTWPQIKGRWTQALESRLKDPNPQPIPEPPKQLAPPPPITDEEAGKRLRELGAKVPGSNNRRAWVGKILERKARNDPTLSDIAYRMALNSENIK